MTYVGMMRGQLHIEVTTYNEHLSVWNATLAPKGNLTRRSLPGTIASYFTSCIQVSVRLIRIMTPACFLCRCPRTYADPVSGGVFTVISELCFPVVRQHRSVTDQEIP